MNKSYKEIVASCKCVDYYDFIFGTKEVWEDAEDVLYVCIWLPQNNGYLPTTIEIVC